MAPIATSQLMDMKKRCPRNVLLQGLAIVLKLLSNVIENPGIAKYRSFKLENKTIKEKVLSIPGMQQFLVDLGFLESYGSLTLDERVLMNDLRVNRGVIQTTHDALLESSTSQQDISHVPIDVPGRRPRFHGGYSGSPKVSIEKSSHPFLSNIDQMLHQVLSYEDTALQDFGRSLIPVEKLRQQTLERMRMQQKSLLSTRGQDPVYEDLFLVVFTEWFSRTFFSWVNKVTCKVCASQVGGRSSGYVENGVRVEEIFCCGQPSKFYRYNDIATLLVTRQVSKVGIGLTLTSIRWYYWFTVIILHILSGSLWRVRELFYIPLPLPGIWCPLYIRHVWSCMDRGLLSISGALAAHRSIRCGNWLPFDVSTRLEAIHWLCSSLFALRRLRRHLAIFQRRSTGAAEAEKPLPRKITRGKALDHL